MAFYLKLPERYNTQGCSARHTPAPGFAPLRLLPPAALRYALITSNYAHFAPLYCYFTPLQCCKSHIIPLTRAETCLECAILC